MYSWRQKVDGSMRRSVGIIGDNTESESFIAIQLTEQFPVKTSGKEVMAGSAAAMGLNELKGKFLSREGIVSRIPAPAVYFAGFIDAESYFQVAFVWRTMAECISIKANLNAVIFPHVFATAWAGNIICYLHEEDQALRVIKQRGFCGKIFCIWHITRGIFF